MGRLKMNFTEQIANGLLLNSLKRVKLRLSEPEEKKLIFTKIIEQKVLEKMPISLYDLLKIGGRVPGSFWLLGQAKSI